MTHQPYRLLITGATGKQGGALIRALLSSENLLTTTTNTTEATPIPHFRITALTRNSTSPSSQRLLASSSSSSQSIDLLQGDLSDTPAIFRQAVSLYGHPQPFDGVFSVQVPLKPQVEEEQGKALVREALKYGVRRFVYTSADRGVDGDTNPTQVAHFRSKFNVEKFLEGEVGRQQREERGDEDGLMRYTIIRPTAFMENMSNDFLGRAFVSMWDLNGRQEKLKFVSTEDVGRMAAKIFLDDMSSDGKRWDGKAINLAGDELTPEQARVIFRNVVGKELPSTYPWLAKVLRWVLQEQLGDMFDFFKKEGFGAEAEQCRRTLPSMLSFETWLKTKSAWKASS